MAVTTTTPPLTLLPDPPLTTDSEDVFNSKTDITLLAQQNMVVQINTALAWQAASMAAALDYKTAAGQSAQAAADSALAASHSATDASQGGAQQVQLAAEQVGLANTARQAAEAAYASAQIVAAAAQAAIGLPALAGNAGKALVVKQDQSGVQFTMLGQAIGEVLIAAAAPDATYLPANDAIYLKSAYPDLAAKLGSVRSRNLKSAFVPTTSAVSSGSLTRVLEGKDGVLVAIGNGVGMRSTDNGATWTSIATLGANAGGVGLSTDGNGTWMAGGSNNQAYRSTDNALTFTAVSVSPGLDNGVIHSITNNGSGVWVLAQSSGTIGYYRSTDNGLTWVQIPSFGVGSAIQSAAMTTLGVCAFLIGSPRALCLNSSSGASGAWTLFSLDAQSTFTRIRAGKSGKLYLMDSSRVMVSEDGGATWDYIPQVFIGSISDLFEESNGSLTVSTNNRIYRSEDLLSWVSVPTGLVSSTTSALTTQTGHSVAVSNDAKVTRAPLAYNYDTATQFRVPKLKAEAGALKFYKAKVAA